MWQIKYALAVPKNLGVGVDFRPCSKGDFLTRYPLSVFYSNKKMNKQEVLFVPVLKGKLKVGRRKKKEIVDLK